MSAEPVAAVPEMRFDVHGVEIEVRADHPTIVSALLSRLEPFVVGSTARDDSPVTFDIHRARASDRSRASSEGRIVYESGLGEVTFIDADERLVIDCERVHVDADLASRVVDIAYASASADELSLAAHPLFTLPLLEIMKREGRYSLHAACVADERGGILLAGESGSGKSTTAVALATAGMTFLADDMVFLDTATEPVTVLGFPDELDLTDATVRAFPALAHLDGAPTWGLRPKHQVPAGELGADVGLRCHPRVLLFPTLGSTDETALELMPAGQALIELAPNVLLTEPSSTQRHLDALGALVRGLPTYRLVLGRDLDGVVDTVLGAHL
jgi:hypothetical protein